MTPTEEIEPMAVLSEPLKMEMVLLFARFRSCAQVVAHLKDEHGVEIDIQQARIYDPTHIKFDAGEKWRPIFDAARKQYLEDVAAVPVASQSYRLNIIQQAIEAAVKNNKWSDAVAYAEQGAKEVGGVLTNQRNLTVDNRGRARDMTPAEREEAMFAIVDEALNKRATDKGTSSVQ